MEGITYRDDPKGGYCEDDAFKPAGGNAHELLSKPFK